jgi:hypothetical protein
MAQADSFSQSDASQSASDAQVRADTDSAEAYTSTMFNDNNMWSFNKKRLVESYQQLDLKLAQDYADLGLQRARNAQTLWETTQAELTKDLSEIRRRSMKQYDDTVTVAHQENQRTVRDGDLASDRKWNLDEIGALFKEIMTEDQPARDALAASIVDSMMNKTKSSS